MAFHAGFVDLYYDTGTIYDLLCFCFYFCAFGLYANVRRSGQFLNRKQLIGLLALYICALNSKEMAVTLPAILLIYEMLLTKRSTPVSQAVTWARRWQPIALTALMTVPYVLGKFSGSSILMGNDAYRVHLGVRTYLRAFAHYLSIFAYFSTDAIQAGGAVIIIVLLAVPALLTRKRTLWFLWFFILVTPLPVAFVPYRGAYAMYVPAFGLALYLSALIVSFRKAFFRGITNSRVLNLQTVRLMQIDTFFGCVILLFVLHTSRPLPDPPEVDRLIHSTLNQLPGVSPPKAISQPRKVLFLQDPFPPDSSDLMYMVRLFYKGPDITVDRVKLTSPAPAPETVDSYDLIFTFSGKELTRIKPPAPAPYQHR